MHAQRPYYMVPACLHEPLQLLPLCLPGEMVLPCPAADTAADMHDSTLDPMLCKIYQEQISHVVTQTADAISLICTYL